MAPLAKIVGDARIVALGEATHGTREIFQLKHRMLECLVSELGFTVFAIEANWPESEAVNRYVLTGEGDPAAALDGLYFWTWNTEEVLDLIRWMRQWNAVPGHRPVKFYGFDMQTASVAARELVAVLKKLDPATAAKLETLQPSFEGRKGGGEPAKTDWKPFKTALDLAAARLRSARPSGVAERDWLVARQYVRVLEQWVELNQQEGNDFAVRDRAMADNVRWIAEVAEPGARIVAWAHNAHVSNAETSRPWMGSHLAKELGDAYLPIGFLFHHGSFQAIDYTGARHGLAEFTLGAPLPGTLEDTFGRAGWPLAVLDLRGRPAGVVADWLDRPQRMRETGAGFSNEQNMVVSRVLPHDFEAVIYVESTTRARPNPRNQNQARRHEDQARPQAAAAASTGGGG
jgi:erythromycin esterase